MSRPSGNVPATLRLAGAVAALLAVTALTAQGATAAAPGRPDPHPVGEGAPPWPAPADPAAAAKSAGLEMLSAEGMVQHTHTHLDVLVDGRPVTVPASIGIDAPHRLISPLHTHDTSGVIHVESPKRADFTLGQFMTEWGVPLSADRIGGLHAVGGRHLKAYVNGRAVAGNPAAIVLRERDEIALVLTRDTDTHPVPASYAWPNGL
ncbi:hypothetical protein DWB77_04348 [Streptomyces hundungensis]|uniref:Uncharacterized protein n=1 Tax=Streptomyces hundungensis TaxID=1077946 RepID=A0A387HMZ4_9ACTN|nr:hypothetical protein [Streptomyces hundungensis]AYG82178.1 hypothetical protein DWB77_04348 [Streptomyces hundungensis]